MYKCNYLGNIDIIYFYIYVYIYMYRFIVYFTTLGVKKFCFSKASLISSFEFTNGKVVSSLTA